MSNRKIAIRIEGLKKMYQLGQIGGGTLQGDLQSWWARVRGKEDPNSKIGSNQRSNGKTFMALNGIDVTIYQGEAVGIIGHNGAGKSTLLKLLSRVTAPTEGQIGINGRIASMLEVGTGFNGEMTGRENVYMNGAILGMTRAEVDSKMEQIIDFSEVREFIDTPVKRYSSGMYVKLAFSVAAHLDSEIMIMDEVLAVGDMAFQKKCLDKMRDAAKEEGRTVLYVSHNMNTIRQLCDRCIVLDQGKVVFEGDVESAIAVYNDNFVKDAYEKDYTEEKRALYGTGIFRMFITHAAYVGKKDSNFQQDSKMEILLKWKNLKDVKNVSMKFEVRSSLGFPVCVYDLHDFYDGKAEEEANAKICVDLQDLMPGDYTTYYTFYTLGQYTGVSGDLDCVTGLPFRIIPKENEVDWRPNLWGAIRTNRITAKMD